MSLLTCRPLSRLTFTLATILVLMGITGLEVRSQSIPVTFKFVPQPTDSFVRAFLPGEFNDWGPNSNGFIAVGAASAMTYDADLDMWLYSWTGLAAGDRASYKVHLHLNESGAQWVWLSDPANPDVDTGNENNSIITFSDPMIFQMYRRIDQNENVVEVSAGLFGLSEFTEIVFSVNGDTTSGQEHFDAQNGIFRYALPEAASPNAEFALLAVTAAGDTVAGKIGNRPLEAEDAPRPPGTKDGINYDPEDATRVTLSLFAPRKSQVMVIGDFNDWEESSDYLMKRDSVNADSTYFWLEVTGLTPGQEYAFQYLIDGELRIGDPYTGKILDPDYDAEIGDTYPGLKPYPSGKTTKIVSVLQTAAPEYEWKIDEFERPPPSELVIYELLVRDFVEAHDYTTLIDSLDYLERLGINAIELMPIAEFNGNENWGYEPNFAFAPDKFYGPSSTLKEFIDACHARGIAVILDVVYNHQAFQAPFSRMYSTSPEGTPGAQPTAGNPWLNPVAKHPFNVFNDVNHESAATRYWLDRVNAHWLTEFKVDGFRFDLSKGFTQNDTGNDVGAWAQRDESRIRLLKRMADRIWEVDSTAYIILEHFSVDSEERELAEHGIDEGRAGMLIWNKVSEQYAEATMGFHEFGKSNFSMVYHRNRRPAWQYPNLISFMESHDEQWMMFNNRKYGACETSPQGGTACEGEGTGYNARHIPIALDRQKMAATFFFTIPGPKMVWQFGELGYGYGPNGRDCLRPSNTTGDFGECPLGTPRRTFPKPIRWDYFEDPLRKRLYLTWSELLRLRREQEVFRSAAETEVEMAVGRAVKTVSLSHETMDVAIIGNFGVSSGEGSPPFTSSGTWYSFFSGDSLNIADVDTVFQLEAGEFHLFTSMYVEPAQADLITVNAESHELPGDELATSSVLLYPNPSREHVSLEFDLRENGLSAIVVYDTLGRRVTEVIVEGTSGRYRETLDVSTLPSGTYFVRIEGNGGTKSPATALIVP
jgi:1,4-alpha-glucan branching enzyme